MASAVSPDWQREKSKRFWEPAKKLLNSIRDYQKYNEKKNLMSSFHKKLAVIRHRFWSVVTGADIPLNSKIAGGLLIPHPNGIVIHPDAKIGPNCLIFQQVTIGEKDGGIPTIGGHVDIGAGAKVLGAIVIGNNVRIGANSVVINDVADGCTVVGIPARVISKI
jgi:serine O-acetyltransferase